MTVCDFNLDPNQGTIVINLDKVQFGQIIWMSSNLPKDGVPGYGDHMGPYWLPLLAANLRAYVGTEWLEEPDVNTEDATIKLTLTPEARGGGINTFTDIRNWVSSYLTHRARILAPAYRG